MRTFPYALAILCGVLVVGCAKSSKIVGDWDMTNGQSHASMSYRADGTISTDVDAQQMPGLKIHVDGTYRLVEDKLYVTPKDAKAVNLPSQFKGHEAEFETEMKKQLKVGVEDSATIKWTDDNDFSVTSASGTISTFKRK